MDSKCIPYLDRWKWWGTSLLIHALVAAAFLYPFTPGKDTANSDDALHAIAFVFAPGCPQVWGILPTFQTCHG